MIEVLKTNVNDRDQAKKLIDQIHKTFMGYHANFDLDDCDRILRIKSVTDSIQVNLLINLLKANGVESEILEDEISLSGTNLHYRRSNSAIQNFKF